MRSSRKIFILLTLFSMILPAQINVFASDKPSDKFLEKSGSLRPLKNDHLNERIKSDNSDDVASVISDKFKNNINYSTQLNNLQNSRVVLENNYKYYLNDQSMVLYREYIDPQLARITYAEEYYPGTVYGVNDLGAGKKSLHIAIDANGYVLYRAYIDQNTQQITTIDEHHDKMRWLIGTAYGYNVLTRYFVKPDKTIDYALVYARGNYITYTHRNEYVPGTKYGVEHENKIFRVISADGKTITENNFKYYLNNQSMALYREYVDPNTKKVTYAEEYYPGTVYGVNDLAAGKKSLYIAIDTNGYVLYRASIDQNTQQRTVIEEHHEKMMWVYGTSYGYNMSTKYYIKPDNTILYALSYAKGDYTTPINRKEYVPGTKYGDNLFNKIVSTSTSNWSIVVGSYKYYMKYTGEVLYREYTDQTTKKITYAEEYYPGTVYGVNDLGAGKKSLHIAIDANGYVLYRVGLDKESQQWAIIEEYHDKMMWLIGTAYGHNVSTTYYVKPDKTIDYALVYARGNYITYTHRNEYVLGTKYGAEHEKKIVRVISADGKTITENNFKYYLNNQSMVLYREYIDPITKKVTYAEEYYPGTVYGVNDIATGKKSLYIAIDADGYVLYRASIDQNTQQRTAIEEHHEKMKWLIGTSYGYNVSTKYYIKPDNTILYGLSYAKGNYTVPINRKEYVPGTKYGDNHLSNITSTSTANWSIVEGNYKYYMKYTGEVLYREYTDPTTKKITYAEEYYLGTVYGVNDLGAGKKSLHIAIDANGYVLYRAYIDQNTQQITTIDEHHDKMRWLIGTEYGYNVSTRYFVKPDKTILYALVYAKGNYTLPLSRQEYATGTKYGDNHLNKVINTNTSNWSIVEGNYKYYMKYTGEVLYREYTDSLLGRLTYAEEYYPGTVYGVNDLASGKKSILISIDANGNVIYRALIDSATQQWTSVEEYHDKMKWAYGTSYGNNIMFRFYVHGDLVIKYAFGYKRGDYETAITKYLYNPGTRYGENHGGNISNEINLIAPKLLYPLASAIVSSDFGWRSHWTGSGASEFHPGIDLAAPAGTHIYAIASGTVVGRGHDTAAGYYINISHNIDGKNITTKHFHMQWYSPPLAVGSYVTSSTIIGYVGSSGNSTGAHLHFEMRLGSTAVNPREYFDFPPLGYSFSGKR